jgi:hypothetical protein
MTNNRASFHFVFDLQHTRLAVHCFLVYKHLTTFYIHSGMYDDSITNALCLVNA